MDKNEFYIIKGFCYCIDGGGLKYESCTRCMTIEEIEEQLRKPDIIEIMMKQNVDEVFIVEPIFNTLHVNYNEKFVASYLINYEKRILIRSK